MPAGAPFGNKNAEKWSLRKSIKLFNAAIELSQEQESYFIKQGEKAIEVTGYKYDFIGEIARELGTFHHLFGHLVKRFPQLQRLKNQLDSNIESNCYYNAKKGTIKEAVGIVNLKSNWDWTDRQSTSNTIEIKTDLAGLSTEELIKRSEAAKTIEQK